MKSYTADQVADTLIAVARSKNIEISNLKLQKLLYYAQAWNLVLNGRPLFEEDFEAWVHGPVIPALFRRFKIYRWNVITDSVEPVKDDAELISHLHNILSVYGGSTPSQLERLSHSEKPWKDARKGIEPTMASNEIISKKSMKIFYSEMLNGQKSHNS